MDQQVNTKFSALIYLSILLLSFGSCSSEKKRMIRAISGTYSIDTTIGDYDIMGKSIYRNLKLTLLEDGNYNFKPTSKFLKGYDGKWDLSNDAEFSYFIFKCNNGTHQSNRVLSIKVIDKKHRCFIYFTKVKM